MKTLTQKLLVVMVLLLTVSIVQAQINSTITIKSITIHNGDTILKEQTYQNDGNTLIYDSLFDNNSRFLFFDKDYHLDTVFDDNFSDIFGTEMNDFLKRFYGQNDNLLEWSFDFFNHKFPLDLDSLITEPFLDEAVPDNKEGKKNENYNFPLRNQYNISCTKTPSPSGSEIINFTLENDDENGYVNVSFLLDAKKSTTITLSNANNKTIYTEKIVKSSGMYTRTYDMTVFDPGIYYITLNQGKKKDKGLIDYKRNLF